MGNDYLRVGPAELKLRVSSSEPPLRHNHLRVAPAELKLRAS